MSRLASLLLLACAALQGCAVRGDDAASTPAARIAPTTPPAPAAAPPDVELVEPGAATVHGTRVAFDGIEEGLAWPALDKAWGAPSGVALTLRVSRALPTIHVLRAAWTLRRASLRVESEDAHGALRVLELGARPTAGGQAVPSGCHLAVFTQPDGSLRVAAPGGPALVAGADPVGLLVRSLEQTRATCPLRYVAFGAESDRAPWGAVFDVALAVEASGAAGAARTVLGQAMLGR